MTESIRPTLLIVYHTQSGHTETLVQAILQGAQKCADCRTIIKQAATADVDDLLTCNGLILGTPENFGYMSGMLKDFFDRTYYPCENRLSGLPYCSVISAGNDGRGAAREITRIAHGYGWKAIADPLIVRHPATPEALASCHDLGAAIANGLCLGIF